MARAKGVESDTVEADAVVDPTDAEAAPRAPGHKLRARSAHGVSEFSCEDQAADDVPRLDVEIFLTTRAGKKKKRGRNLNNGRTNATI